ncbi:hypothetical protein PN613_12755 [Parabacteroides distasonis]|uniref:hypothetical protein n=1 Tax=Parabacteroides distasonis TaxID=823 RepID=UPI00189A90A7|nr:hypothetical protein [Parabacteroides distasonis]MDB9072108.1 hypothetical protein [Parabacteroides distasonis]
MGLQPVSRRVRQIRYPAPDRPERVGGPVYRGREICEYGILRIDLLGRVQSIAQLAFHHLSHVDRDHLVRAGLVALLEQGGRSFLQDERDGLFCPQYKSPHVPGQAQSVWFIYDRCHLRLFYPQKYGCRMVR